MLNAISTIKPTPTWMSTEPSSPRLSERFMTVAFRSEELTGRGAAGHRRRVDRAAATLQVRPDVVRIRQERARQRRHRRNFVWIERAHEPRGDQNEQLGPFLPLGLALEQIADDRNLAEQRHRCHVGLRLVVDEAGDGERLTVAQLDLIRLHVRPEVSSLDFNNGIVLEGFRIPALTTRRDAESLEHDAVVEVERADFRTDMQPDEVAGNRRFEIQPDAKLLEQDRNRPGRALHDRYGEFTTSQEARLLAVVGDQIRLGQALEVSVGLQRLDQRAGVVLGIEQKQVQEVGEHETALVLVEVRRGELLRGAPPDPVLVAAGAVKNEVPSSINARRLTSANRTCSITCCESLAPGTCSMLRTFAFGAAARATSAARSMTAVDEARPDSTIASALTVTLIGSPGKSCRSCCSSAAIGCSITRSYCSRRSPPQTMRLIVPGALPSIRISRGRTTTASAMVGLVMAIRETSNSVVSTVDRPAVSVTFG